MRALMLLMGAAVCALLAANNAYQLYLLRESYVFAVRLPAGLFWTGFFLILSAACVLGALMKPREFRQVFKEEPPPRPDWLDELSAPRKDQD